MSVACCMHAEVRNTYTLYGWKWSWGSSVDIVTGYRLEGRRSSPGRDNIFLFSTTPRPDLGPTQLLIHWVPGTITTGLNRLRCDVAHHLVLRSRMVELYPYSDIECKGVDWICLRIGCSGRLLLI
jgi:hypothetical protein